MRSQVNEVQNLLNESGDKNQCHLIVHLNGNFFHRVSEAEFNGSDEYHGTVWTKFKKIKNYADIHIQAKHMCMYVCFLCMCVFWKVELLHICKYSGPYKFHLLMFKFFSSLLVVSSSC